MSDTYTPSGRFKEPAQLHNHSYYSLLDGIPSVEEWVAWALTHDTPGIAITDHGIATSMYHAVRYPSIIKDYNEKYGTSYPLDKVIGIPGVEFYFKWDLQDPSYYHLNAWAVSTEGYKNLMKLASVAWENIHKRNKGDKGKPIVTPDLIKQYSTGISFGTACVGSPMGKAIIKDDYDLAEKYYQKYMKMFGKSLYVEIHPNDLNYEYDRKTNTFIKNPATVLAPDGNRQKAYNNFLLDMVEKHGGKLIPATDAHFLYKEDKILQDIMLRNESKSGWTMYESYNAMTADLIYDKLKKQLGDRINEEIFASWIDNTHKVMNGAKTITIEHGYVLPQIDIPEGILAKTDDYNKQLYLLLIEKIKKHGRWRKDQVYIDRFNKEVDVIMNNDTINFLPYFLMYEDICSYARGVGVLLNLGRGSAGGSLLSYYLKIIHVDPILHNLPFERFLSFARIRAGSFPDIDLDISDRNPILLYLKQKYNFGFAQIVTFGTMKAKSAIKAVMSAIYGKNGNEPEVRAVCDFIPDSPQGTKELEFIYGHTDKDGLYHEGVVETVPEVANFFKRMPDVEKLVKRLIGVVNTFRGHASGYVVCSLDITKGRIPVMKLDSRGVNVDVGLWVTQCEAPMVDKVGLIKADILRINTLATVQSCVSLIKQRTGLDLLEEDELGIAAIYRLPEVPEVYDDFYNKRTDSSFQFNTAMIKSFAQDFSPKCREDLAILTALVRPGALDVEAMPGVSATQMYIDVRKGAREPIYIHPDLESILASTNGVVTFQEQLMEILVKFCGYTLEDSDIIRSAIAKKKHHVMVTAFERVRSETCAKGWSKEQSEGVCNVLSAYSNYSFNRSHSKSYSELGYITLYAKHFYPLEWWCSVLNTEEDETKLRYFVSLLGDKVLSPSIENCSGSFIIRDDRILAPISAIKGLGDKSSEHIRANAPYSSLEDFLHRTNPTKVNVGHLGHLIRSRAFDCYIEDTGDYNYDRKILVDKIYKLRKINKKPDEDLYNFNALELFYQERDLNKVFSKSFASVPEIRVIAKDLWPGLQETNNPNIPFTIDGVHVLKNLRTAVALFDGGLTEDREFAFILSYQGCEHRSGIAKKTGKPWNMLKVQLSDGIEVIEGVIWKREIPLKYPIDSLVLVIGKLSAGYKSPLSLTINDIMRGINQ